MFEFGMGVAELAVQTGTIESLLVPAEQTIQFENQDGVSTIFNIIKTGIRLMIGGAVLIAVGFFVFGAITLMRASGNPQMFEKARNQMIYSVAGAVLASAAFLGVGTAVDFVSGASGGTTVDVGDISSVQQGANTIVNVSGFLGIYNGAAVTCPSTAAGGTALAVSTMSDNAGTLAAQWTWTPATPATATAPIIAAFCTKVF